MKKTISTITLFFCTLSLLVSATVKIGVTAGPQEQIFEKVAQLAQMEGITVELVVFTDYVLPNIALSEGSLDANSYQHIPFLNNFNKDRKTTLVPIGGTIILPMAVYSNSLTSLDINTLKAKSKVAIPNDPSNGGRALLLLEKAGLITLKENPGTSPSVRDIKKNPKRLKFIELEASQIPKYLNEVSIAVINSNYAVASGINPVTDSIFLEDKNSPYACAIVTTKEKQNDKTLLRLAQLYQTSEVEDFINTTFAGSIVRGW